MTPRLCTFVHFRNMSEPEKCNVGIVVGVIDGDPIIYVLRTLDFRGPDFVTIAYTVRPSERAPQGRGTWHLPDECQEGR